MPRTRFRRQSTVQRILEAHQLAPHRIRTFELSNDPKFAEKPQPKKLRDDPAGAEAKDYARPRGSLRRNHTGLLIEQFGNCPIESDH